nr:hypothetical protein [Candidatus Sigynarchaeota archaeon]
MTKYILPYITEAGHFGAGAEPGEPGADRIIFRNSGHLLNPQKRS